MPRAPVAVFILFCWVIVSVGAFGQNNLTFTSNIPVQIDPKIIDRAKSLIPYVQSKQQGLFANAVKNWSEDRNSFFSSVDRYGDFVALYIERHGVKTIVAVNVVKDSPITLVEGHSPDLRGSDNFRLERTNYDSIKNADVVLVAPRVTLPDDPANHTKMDLSSDWCCNSMGRNIPVTVDHLERAAEDDQIIFGYGSPQAMTFSGSNGMYIHTPPGATMTGNWSTKFVGYTLNVPAGEGQRVYEQILKAGE